MSKEAGNADKTQKIRFKNTLKKNVLGGVFFALAVEHGHTNSGTYTTETGVSLLAVPTHPPLQQLWCFCDSGLNCFCVKSAENKANIKGNRFLPGCHAKMVEHRMRKETGIAALAMLAHSDQLFVDANPH